MSSKADPGYHRKRKPGMWHAYTVLSIIAQEAYGGIWHFGARIRPTRFKRPKEEWIEIEVPALVDRWIWEEAQEIRKQNKQFSRRNKKHDYLLSGLIRCTCGWAMSGEFFSNHQYYTCSWRNNHHTHLEERLCRARSVRADAIEKDVWESIKKLFGDLENLERLLRLAQQEEIAVLDPKMEELSAVEAVIVQAEADAIEVGQALRHASGVVAKSLKRDEEEVNSRQEALCKRRDALQVDLSERRLTDHAIREFIQFAQDIAVGIQNADFQAKRRNLEMLQVRVLVEDGKFKIECLAGEISGDIRKLPIIRKPGVGGVTNSRSQAPCPL